MPVAQNVHWDESVKYTNKLREREMKKMYKIAKTL